MTIKTILNYDMSVAYITDCTTSPVGVLGPLVFLFIYRKCLACRYCT
jgi:hypothetical protein